MCRCYTKEKEVSQTAEGMNGDCFRPHIHPRWRTFTQHSQSSAEVWHGAAHCPPAKYLFVVFPAQDNVSFEGASCQRELYNSLKKQCQQCSSTVHKEWKGFILWWLSLPFRWLDWWLTEKALRADMSHMRWHKKTLCYQPCSAAYVFMSEWTLFYMIFQTLLLQSCTNKAVIISRRVLFFLKSQTRLSFCYKQDVANCFADVGTKASLHCSLFALSASNWRKTFCFV